jgi:DNA-binding CsgD family transcriptional regulator
VAVSVGTVVAGRQGRISSPTSRSAVQSVLVALFVGTVATHLELAAAGLDHGTHLLILLTLVMAAALMFGTGPGATAVAVGGGISTAASVISIDDVFLTPLAYVQVLTYLVSAMAFVMLLPLARRDRRRAAAPTPGPRTVDVRRPGPIEPLTTREREVLRLAATGIKVDDIADMLFLSPNTVKTHLTHVYAKLGVRGRSDAVRAALHAGCLTPADICPHVLDDMAEESPVTVSPKRRKA